MFKVILDCDLMRYPDSGLYHYCLNLGLEVKNVFDVSGQGKISFYIPPAEKRSFGKDASLIVDKPGWRNTFKPFMWDCDIWHAPFQSGRIVPDKKNKRLKVVLTVHDLNVLHEGKSEKEQKQSIAHTQSLINRADVIVCISEFCKQDVLKHCDVGNKRVQVIHNGTNRVDVSSLNGIEHKPKRPFLFTLGYVNRKKNQHVLLPLLKDLDVDLIIAGKLDDSDYVAEIKKSAEEMGVMDKLHVLGPVSEKDKAWYLQNCKAFVFPSLAEGFGAPVVEAMAFGKPLFLSDRTSLPEVGGDVAFYFRSFKPEDMIRVFHEGMKQYEANKMYEIIKRRINVFEWKEKVKEYVNLYMSVCNS